MSIWTAATNPLGHRKCKRCHRLFTPRKEGQEYGPTCARKVAGQMEALERYGEAQKEVLV